MPRKKIVREPVEKLSSDAIVEITEDSSSDEESDLTPIVKPKPVKKPRTPKQLANDQRLRDLKKKKKVVEPVNELDVTAHPVKPVPIADVDPEDKPMTARQMKAYMAQMNAKPKEAPVKKPRKKRATKEEMATRKSEKVVMETPTPPPPPPPLVRSKPQIMFV